MKQIVFWNIKMGSAAAFRQLLLLALALLALPILAQTDAGTNAPAVTNSGPRIELAEDLFDFGRIEAGRVVSHDFAFTNAGNQTLEIRDIDASCGCTTIGEWDHKVEPGKSGIIPLMLNTTELTGPTLKNIKLTCNDPSQPRLVLYMKVDVYKLVDARPKTASFAFGPDFQANQTRTIWITNNMEQAVTVRKPAFTNDSFKAELNTIIDGSIFQLLVTAVPPLPEGTTVFPITIPTSSPKMPEIAVNVYASVQPSVSLRPSRIFLNPGPLKEAATFTIAIRNQSTNALRLSEPVITGKGAGVKLAETEPGREFALTLTLPAGFRIQQNETVEVRVKSNRPSSPWIIVPVLQYEGGDDSDVSGPGSSPVAPTNAAPGAVQKPTGSKPTATEAVPGAAK
jgi:hypothetical protein